MTRKMASTCKLSLSSLAACIILMFKKSQCNEPSHLVCAIDNFDYYNLTTVTWTVKLNKTHCLHPVNSTETPVQCTILMAFCRKIGSVGPCQNSAICHRSDNDDDLNLGGYTENPFKKLDFPHDSNGFQAAFLNGSDYANSSCQLQTRIEFLCNHSAQWLVRGILSQTERESPAPKLVTYDNQTCQMTLIFDYAGACEILTTSQENLSAGIMVIAVFSVALIFYFVFGCFINIVRGQTGSQVVPHARFWGMLPIYIMDGCQFVVFCGRKPVTPIYEQI